MSGKKILAFDGTNLFYRTFFVHLNEDAEIVNGLVYHSTIMSMFAEWRKYKPHHTIIAFDRPNWRKAYTKSDKCVSQRVYKGTRKAKMAPAVEEKYAQFIQFVAEVEQMFREYTTVKCMSCELLEADDILGGLAHRANAEGDTIRIVSTDKDMIQLLGLNKTKKVVELVNPIDKKMREHEDPEFYLFEKCIRGDHVTDNIQSAYPKVRMTKIKEAYTNEFARANLMAETWKNEDGREFVVGDLFKENILLTDLTAQPNYIKEMIDLTIDIEMEKKIKFSNFQLTKFLGKHQMKKLAAELENYLPMLAA